MKKDIFYTLDDAIGYIKTEKFSEDFDRMLLNKRKTIIKKSLIILLSISLGFVISIITPQPLSLLTFALSSGLIYKIPNIISKIHFNKTKNNNIINFKDYIKEKDYRSIDELIEESEFLVESEIFIKEVPNAYIDNNIEEQDECYLESILNKKETIDRIFYEIEGYYDLYNLPPMNITEEEWNAFFDGVYASLKDFADSTYYYAALYTIVRFTLSKALMFNYRSIKITDFINNLYYLEEKYNIFNFSLSKFEILFTQRELLNKITKKINFNEYILKRNKRLKIDK